MRNIVLHIAVLEHKFLPPFIDYINQHNDCQHKFVMIYHTYYNYDLIPKNFKNTSNVHYLEYNDQEGFDHLLDDMYHYHKIILHGLWKDKLDTLLYNNPKLFQKCYWIMWGGDFYFPEKQTQTRHQVIKNINYLVTGSSRDYEYVKQHYQVQGKLIKCYSLYLNNIFTEVNIPCDNLNEKNINILVGNSADPSNNHIAVLEQLVKYKNQNIKIFMPLSYGGNKEYIDLLIHKGKQLFGQQFIPLMDFIPHKDYISFLKDIQIAIFNHNRQQAFGSIITLLGLGKTLYMNSENTLCDVLNEVDITFFEIKNFNMQILTNQQKISNHQRIKDHFSEGQMIKCHDKIFLGDTK